MMGTHIGKQSVLIEANGVRIAAQSIEGLGDSTAVGNPHLLGPYAEERPVSVCLKCLKVQSLASLPASYHARVLDPFEHQALNQ